VSCGSPGKRSGTERARLRPHDAELVGEVVQYGNKYRVCYVRGPKAILALAEEIG
jgi:hypothetical protein